MQNKAAQLEIQFLIRWIAYLEEYMAMCRARLAELRNEAAIDDLAGGAK